MNGLNGHYTLQYCDRPLSNVPKWRRMLFYILCRNSVVMQTCSARKKLMTHCSNFTKKSINPSLIPGYRNIYRRKQNTQKQKHWPDVIKYRHWENHAFIVYKHLKSLRDFTVSYRVAIRAIFSVCLRRAESWKSRGFRRRTSPERKIVLICYCRFSSSLHSNCDRSLYWPRSACPRRPRGDQERQSVAQEFRQTRQNDSSAHDQKWISPLPDLRRRVAWTARCPARSPSSYASPADFDPSSAGSALRRLGDHRRRRGCYRGGRSGRRNCRADAENAGVGRTTEERCGYCAVPVQTIWVAEDSGLGHTRRSSE